MFRIDPPPWRGRPPSNTSDEDEIDTSLKIAQHFLCHYGIGDEAATLLSMSSVARL
jgi:hypothetical protein